MLICSEKSLFIHIYSKSNNETNENIMIMK